MTQHQLRRQRFHKFGYGKKAIESYEKQKEAITKVIPEKNVPYVARKNINVLPVSGNFLFYNPEKFVLVLQDQQT